VVVQERAFTDAAIRKLLAAGGLKLLRVDTQVRIDGQPVRKVYVAVKPLAGAAGRSPTAETAHRSSSVDTF